MEIKKINLKVKKKKKKSDNRRSTPEKSRCLYTSLIEKYVEDSIREIQLSCKPEKAASLGKTLGSPNQNDSTCLFSCQKSEKTCLADDEIWMGMHQHNEHFQGSLSIVGLLPELLHQRSAQRTSVAPISLWVPRAEGTGTHSRHPLPQLGSEVGLDAGGRQNVLSSPCAPSTD